MNVYEIVTAKIVNLLESGVVLWRQGWPALGMPRNLVSRKFYRGINYFLLSATKAVSPFWPTFRQAGQLGGSVRAGEQSAIVVFWKVEDQADDDTLEADTDAKPLARKLLGSRVQVAHGVPEKTLDLDYLRRLPHSVL